MQAIEYLIFWPTLLMLILFLLFYIGGIHFDLASIFSETHESSACVLNEHNGAKGKADASHQACKGKACGLASDESKAPGCNSGTDPLHIVREASSPKAVVKRWVRLDCRVGHLWHHHFVRKVVKLSSGRFCVAGVPGEPKVRDA